MTAATVLIVNQEAIKNISPSAAYEILTRQPHAVLVDVRSRVEFDYVGHPIGAIHIPWKEFPDWTDNPGFVADVAAALNQRRSSKDGPLVLICRSGARSMAAARLLAENGYTALYNVDEGFEGDKDEHNHRNTVNGWRARGLPWEQT